MTSSSSGSSVHWFTLKTSLTRTTINNNNDATAIQNNKRRHREVKLCTITRKLLIRIREYVVVHNGQQKNVDSEGGKKTLWKLKARNKLFAFRARLYANTNNNNNNNNNCCCCCHNELAHVNTNTTHEGASEHTCALVCLSSALRESRENEINKLNAQVPKCVCARACVYLCKCVRVFTEWWF